MKHKNQVDVNNEYLTTSQGAPVDDDTSSLTVGSDGPVLLEDIHLLDKLAHFDRERIPERVVHAKGAGAHGYFKLTKCMKKYTKAKIFTELNCKTQVFVRFSTVIGSKGSADTARDPRGFAVKFYTEEGNYDIVGNNIPVFFIRDAIKFPDMVHAFKPSPDTNLHDAGRFWDFIANTPESTHMITWLYSDKGTIKSFRTTPGFGVHTFVWINDNGERVFVKYHWIPLAGDKNITRQEAEMLAGLDPDIATRDLSTTLASGKVVEYDLAIQLMDIKESRKLCFDPLDATKVWPEKDFPLMKIGRMTLTDNPDNFFEESEQVAFSPGNLVPGVEPSFDKLLQGRLFSYHDTQRHRLGPNFTQIPINKPKSPVKNNQRDGSMAYSHNKGAINYNPSSLDKNPSKLYPNNDDKPVNVSGDIERRVIYKTDDFTQAENQYNSYTRVEKEHLIDNIVTDLWSVDKEVQLKVIENLYKASKELGNKVKEGLNLKCKSGSMVF